MKKTIKITLIAIIIIILNFGIVANSVKATTSQEIQIYTTGNLNRFLKYDGMLIKTAHAIYEENGKQYPAYCLNKDLQGVGDQIVSYQTTNGGKITDIGLWRVIINGYPYKSLEQLGVESEEEAYIATKQSIYCYIYNRGTEKYSGIGDAGARTVQAMNIILENAKNSTENFNDTQIEVIQSEKWLEHQKTYISKEYKIKSNINIAKYSINLENQPKGTIITNINDEEQTEFNSSEKFKILIPIASLEKSGKFKIKIQTQLETKPVIYGKAPDSSLQDYALTGFSYEEVPTELNQEYEKNETEITIEKQDEKTKQNLAGAKFQILDQDYKIIKEVETDEKGQIKLQQIMPGKYYIKEIKAPEGYEINNNIQEIDIQLNQKKTIKIENSKIIIEETKEIEIPKEEPIKKLPVTGY